MLQVALANGEGFIKVVGEVGTGKTLLCRQLLNTLDDHYVTAYIPNPFLTPSAFFRALAEELGGQCRTRDGINEYQKIISEQLMARVALGKKVVLIIDEAQAMPVKTLEALRLVSNLETETTKLIHIVLFGQPELDTILSQHDLRQLRQRISFSCQLPPLDQRGVALYINHRVSRAGYNGGDFFSPAAIALICKSSRGIPRLINILCHKALMCAYGKGARAIGAEHVKAAIKDTEEAAMPGWFSWLRISVSAAAVTLVAGSLYCWLPGVTA